jgi:hypothetical protein
MQLGGVIDVVPIRILRCREFSISHIAGERRPADSGHNLGLTAGEAGCIKLTHGVSHVGTPYLVKLSHEISQQAWGKRSPVAFRLSAEAIAVVLPVDTAQAGIDLSNGVDLDNGHELNGADVGGLNLDSVILPAAE